MTSKKTRVTVRGAFRVSDDVLFQKDTRDDPEFSKKVGNNHPTGRRKTRMEFEDLRGVDQDKKTRVGMKGTARLSMDEGGKWSGTFIDGDGIHWDFKCSRIQE